MALLESSVRAQSTEQVIVQSVEPFMEAIKKYIEKGVRTYTIDELCEVLKTSKPTINALRDCGVLNPIRLGNKDIYPEEQIREFLIDYSGADLSNATTMKAELIRRNKKVTRCSM